MARNNKALIVVTSHLKLGKTGRPTGFHYEQLAAVYWCLSDAGYDIDIASISGGKAIPDPASIKEKNENSALVQRFLNNNACLMKLNYTIPANSIIPTRYGVVFLAGGHGAMWDFASSAALGNIVSLAYEEGAIISALSHGVAGLIAATNPDGKAIVEGLRINAFTDAEEKASRYDKVVPFLLESTLRELGGVFECGESFQPYVVCDGALITGQNHESLDLFVKILLMVINATPK